MFFPYIGNKRTEMSHIEPFINLDNIDYIVEPFCGSCSFSLFVYNEYLRDKNKKLKFRCNDIEERLIAIFNDVKKGNIEDYLNYGKSVQKLDMEEKKKISKKYLENIHNTDKENLLRYFYIACSTFKSFTMFMPRDVNRKYDLSKKQVIMTEFCKSKDVKFICSEYKKIFDKYRENKNALLFIDPPYLNSFNVKYDTYYDKNIDVSSYYVDIKNLLKNAKCKVIVVINNICLMNDYYKDFIKCIYGKTYQTYKTKTEHMILTNF